LGGTIDGVQIGDLADRILLRAGEVRLVAIDGPGGAGKSTFASVLAAALDGAPIVHTDDFASADNAITWWPRLLEQVIDPLVRSEPAHYQRYDWPTKSLAEWIDLEPAPVVIVEGVTAARNEWRHHLAFIIWIETPQLERLRRGLDRDGDNAVEDWETWGSEEDQHYVNDPTRHHADVIVDGNMPVVDGEFATLPLAP
jgi:uridine kinase